MASDSDLILLSCLVKAPAAGDVTGAVQSVLQSVLVRTPSAMRDNPAGYARGAATGVASAAAAAANGPLPHLRSMCPSSHTAFVDARLLRGFPLSRARTVLAGLSPLPVGMSELPSIVAGIGTFVNPCHVCC